MYLIQEFNSSNTALPLRAAEVDLCCRIGKLSHEVNAATSIRQERRAKAHRRRQCQTLYENSSICQFIKIGGFI